MKNPNFSQLKALFINCTLKKSPQSSHTSKLINVSKQIMQAEGVAVEDIRLVDYDVPAGVAADMTKEGYSNDDWPILFEKVMAADVLIIGTPIWLGEKSSVAQKLIERLYAMSSEINEKGQYIYYGRVGGCIVTGNEDGIKHCGMGILYSLQHIGYSIPPQADAGWIGEVGPGPSYGDTKFDGKEINPPIGFDSDFTNRNTTFMTYNILHLAAALKSQSGYPNYGNSKEDWTNGERWAFKKPTE